MNQISWRHHYIPQFYLNGFTNPENKFSIYNVQSGKFVKSGKEFHPESYFFEKNGNTLITKNEKTDFIEKHYAIIDSRNAEIFNRINENSPNENFNISDDDIAILQHFVGVMYWRNPSNYNEVKHLISQKTFKELGLIIKNDNNEEVALPELEGRLKTDNNFFKSMKSYFADISYPELFDCKSQLHILSIPNMLSSVCSDNPIICKDPSNFRVYSDDFIFPLSSNRILIRGKIRQKISTLIKPYIDLIIYKQAKSYVSFTNDNYRNQLDTIFQKLGYSLKELREKIFKDIIE